MLTPALACALLAATPPAGAPRLETPAVVEKVQKRYDAASDFRARFTQTLTSVAMGRKTNSAGSVMFKKPGRMRWDYDKPEKSSYVSDGGVLWLYEPDDQQAFKQELGKSQLPAALAFLTGKGKLAAEFDITPVAKSPYGAPGDYLLSLSPKVAEPQVKSILFVVDPKTFDVRESIITDGQGNTNDLTFADIKTNTHLPESQFRFVPPAGTRVIDTAKLGK
ncbi:MAG TPA: outer membrane lipoprotein chaperone LolA [Polyangia bacterium]|nr:outer membrane lipoprotein chaperone LolA [Polyangia bacterium]